MLTTMWKPTKSIPRFSPTNGLRAQPTRQRVGKGRGECNRKLQEKEPNEMVASAAVPDREALRDCEFRHHCKCPRRERVGRLLCSLPEFWRLERAFSRGVQPLKEHRRRVRRPFLRNAMRWWNVPH